MTSDRPPRIPLWIDLRAVPSRRRIPYLRAAKRAEAEAVLVAGDEPEADRPDAIVAKGKRLLRDGTEIGRIVPMKDAAAQEEASRAQGTVLVEGGDWTIIPLENLIAAREDRPGTLFALARSPEAAGVFRDTLEHGVHGVALAPAKAADIDAADAILRQKGLPGRKHVRRAGSAGRARPTGRTGPPADKGREAGPAAATLALETAKIIAIEDAGPGDRICVDTTSAFRRGEGLLVGSTARSFALVHAETVETEFVAARPFRVNAGALHSYVLADGGKTRYLSELSAGSRVTAVDADGRTRVLTVGRAKLEHRPHLLVRWRSKGGDGSAILQNAETIRLVRPGGEALSVTQAKPGDKILVHREEAARHFGMPVDERLEER